MSFKYQKRDSKLIMSFEYQKDGIPKLIMTMAPQRAQGRSRGAGGTVWLTCTVSS